MMTLGSSSKGTQFRMFSHEYLTRRAGIQTAHVEIREGQSVEMALHANRRRQDAEALAPVSYVIHEPRLSQCPLYS
jgi:hypothetical protein